MNTRFLSLNYSNQLTAAVSDSCGQIWIGEQPAERGDPFLRGDDLLLQAGSGSRDLGRSLLPSELQRARLHHGGQMLWIFRQDGVQVQTSKSAFNRWFAFNVSILQAALSRQAPRVHYWGRLGSRPLGQSWHYGSIHFDPQISACIATVRNIVKGPIVKVGSLQSTFHRGLSIVLTGPKVSIPLWTDLLLIESQKHCNGPCKCNCD